MKRIAAAAAATALTLMFAGTAQAGAASVITHKMSAVKCALC